MTRFSLAMFLAVCRRGDLSGAVQPWILKLERAKRWASERAAIKAEVTRAAQRRLGPLAAVDGGAPGKPLPARRLTPSDRVGTFQIINMPPL